MHDSFAIEVFYDGGCPLCVREIDLLRRLDRRGRIRFTDLEAAGFDPGALGTTYEALMERIHGRLPDGRLIVGVEVFRALYGAVGLAPLVWISRLPGIALLLEIAYEIFADNRLRWTGRCDASCATHARHAWPHAQRPPLAWS